MKYILWIGLTLIILWFFRRPKIRRSRTMKKPGAHQAERMVKCVGCGVYIPESESVRDGAIYYCCAEHRRAAQVPID